MHQRLSQRKLAKRSKVTLDDIKSFEDLQQPLRLNVFCGLVKALGANVIVREVSSCEKSSVNPVQMRSQALPTVRQEDVSQDARDVNSTRRSRGKDRGRNRRRGRR